MNSNSPLVTVLMPVFNGSRFLAEAIESILHQTFEDFEFVIIDDGSKDNSFDIICQYNDERLKIIQNRKNIGLAKTLNLGLEFAKGDYVARMDQDDISVSTRLEREVEFLDRYPDLGMVSTNCYIIDSSGKINNKPIYSNTLKGGEVEWHLFWGYPIIHPSVMFRTRLVQSLNGYPEMSEYHVEDYLLWFRLLREKSIIVINKPLLYLRKHDLNSTKVDLAPHIEEIVRANQMILTERLNYEPSADGIRLIRNFLDDIKPSLKNSKMSIMILTDAYKYLTRKHHLDNIQLKRIQIDLVNRFINLIKINIPYGILRVALLFGQALSLLPIGVIKRLFNSSFLQRILHAKF